MKDLVEIKAKIINSLPNKSAFYEGIIELKTGALSIESILIKKDQNGTTSFPEIPEKIQEYYFAILHEKLKTSKETIDTAKLTFTVAQNKFNQFRLLLRSEEREEDRKKEAEDKRQNTSTVKYGKQFAQSVGRFILKNKLIYHEYNPRDQQGDAIWMDHTGSFRVGHFSSRHNAATATSSQFELSNLSNFTQWFEEQSDRSLHDFGINLSRKKIELLMQ
jgi:hypothetical protein